MLCIVAGTGLGNVAPGLAKALDGMAIYVNGAPMVSIAIWQRTAAGSTVKKLSVKTERASRHTDWHGMMSADG